MKSANQWLPIGIKNLQTENTRHNICSIISGFHKQHINKNPRLFYLSSIAQDRTSKFYKCRFIYVGDFGRCSRCTGASSYMGRYSYNDQNSLHIWTYIYRILRSDPGLLCMIETDFKKWNRHINKILFLL